MTNARCFRDTPYGSTPYRLNGMSRGSRRSFTSEETGEGRTPRSLHQSASNLRSPSRADKIRCRPMNARPRIDLDGVSLVDAAKPPMVIAVFRYRTAEGLVLLIPESADILVPWEHVDEAALDLMAGTVRIVLRPSYVERQNW